MIFSDEIYINSITFIGDIKKEEYNLSKIIRSKESSLLNKQYYDKRIINLDKITLKNYFISKGYLEVEIKLLPVIKTLRILTF